MSLTFSEALGIAARCWCLPKTGHAIMDTELASAFATVLVEISAGRPDPNLAKEPAAPEIRGQDFPGFEAYAGGELHLLKTAPDSFQALLDGIKTSEWRKNDRDFKVGDILVLREWKKYPLSNLGEEAPCRYSGRVACFEIAHMVCGPDFGINEGFCVMSVKPWKGSISPPEPTMIYHKTKLETIT